LICSGSTRKTIIYSSFWERWTLAIDARMIVGWSIHQFYSFITWLGFAIPSMKTSFCYAVSGILSRNLRSALQLQRLMVAHVLTDGI
jgi:hypothetical protein